MTGQQLQGLRLPLLKMIGPRLPRWLSRRVDPEDVLQETYLRVWGSREGKVFETEGLVLAYLWTTAQNVVNGLVNAHRAQKRSALQERPGTFGSPSKDWGPLFEAQVREAEEAIGPFPLFDRSNNRKGTTATESKLETYHAAQWRKKLSKFV